MSETWGTCQRHEGRTGRIFTLPTNLKRQSTPKSCSQLRGHFYCPHCLCLTALVYLLTSTSGRETVFGVNCCFKRRRNCSQVTGHSFSRRPSGHGGSVRGLTEEAGTAKGLVQLKTQQNKEDRQVRREQSSPEVSETDSRVRGHCEGGHGRCGPRGSSW